MFAQRRYPSHLHPPIVLVLNVRVADVDRVYKEWSAKGAQFLTDRSRLA